MYRRGQSWIVDFIYKGKRIRKSLGNISKKEAKAKEEKLRQEVKNVTEMRTNISAKIAKHIDKVEEYLRLLETKIKEYKNDLMIMQKKLKGKNLMDYPSVPPPIFEIGQPCAIIPDGGGVYFVWRKEVLMYIGKAKSFLHRIELGSHKILKKGDKISFLNFNDKERDYAECFYIGFLKPPENFDKKIKTQQNNNKFN